MNDRATVRPGPDLRCLRNRRHRRFIWGIALAGLVAVLGATIVWRPAPKLVWNVSASAPRGLYAVGGRGLLAVGDMVIAHVPANWRTWAGRRRYIPVNVPLVKRVAAVPGDSVCAIGRRILVNGRLVAARRAADGAGRPMPRWSGCLTLRHGAHFLLMDNPASFDGRYFGPTARSDIIGEAQLLWRR